MPSLLWWLPFSKEHPACIELIDLKYSKTNYIRAFPTPPLSPVYPRVPMADEHYGINPNVIIMPAAEHKFGEPSISRLESPWRPKTWTCIQMSPELYAWNCSNVKPKPWMQKRAGGSWPWRTHWHAWLVWMIIASILCFMISSACCWCNCWWDSWHSISSICIHRCHRCFCSCCWWWQQGQSFFVHFQQQKLLSLTLFLLSPRPILFLLQLTLIHLVEYAILVISDDDNESRQNEIDNNGKNDSWTRSRTSRWRCWIRWATINIIHRASSFFA